MKCRVSVGVVVVVFFWKSIKPMFSDGFTPTPRWVRGVASFDTTALHGVTGRTPTDLYEVLSKSLSGYHQTVAGDQKAVLAL